MADPTIRIALDAIECSNRCRHCETSYGPRRRHLSRDEIRSWANRVRHQAERLGVQVELGTNNSELLDHPQWRDICSDFGQEKLGRALATNGRALARNPELVEELKERGVQWLQLTLGGGSRETHDAFTRRRGSFDGIVSAAWIAHAAGLHVCWNYIAYRPLAEIRRMSELAASISGSFSRGQFEHKGGIDQGMMLVKPQGEGVRMEHLHPSSDDLVELPEWASIERFGTWFGVGCETEGDLVDALLHTERRFGCIELGQDKCCLVCCRNGDIYPLCHERTPDYLLGNLHSDGLGAVLDRFSSDRPPALAVRRRGLEELAAAYGKTADVKLHNGCSFCRTLVGRALRTEGAASRVSELHGLEG